jgi:mevalonate kinase
MSIAVSAACGKAILLGEHAVVHGAPALVVGLPRGARARAETVELAGAEALTASSLVLGGHEHRAGGTNDLSRAFAGLLAALSCRRTVRVRAESELPSGGGLGSSAALGVAIARAVGALDGTAPSLEATERAALAFERVFHGNPSGVDVAAAARGGCLRFVRGTAPTSVTLAQSLHLCVGFGGRGASTRRMVELVAERLSRFPTETRAHFEWMGHHADDVAASLASGDVAGVGPVLDEAHERLRALGVSTSRLDELCHAARRAGALGAKLTGAGGGGSVLALVASPERAGAVVDAWTALGAAAFATSVEASE